MGGEDKERTTQPLVGLPLKMAEASTNCSPIANYSSRAESLSVLDWTSAAQNKPLVAFSRLMIRFQNVIQLRSVSPRRAMIDERENRPWRETCWKNDLTFDWGNLIPLCCIYLNSGGRAGFFVAARTGKDWWSTVGDRAGNSILFSRVRLHCSGAQLWYRKPSEARGEHCVLMHNTKVYFWATKTNVNTSHNGAVISLGTLAIQTHNPDL